MTADGECGEIEDDDDSKRKIRFRVVRIFYNIYLFLITI